MANINRGQRENALQEVLRLTKAFEREMCPEGSGKVVKLSLEPDGSGAIEYGDEFCRGPVFEFESSSKLKEFLMVGMPERLLILAQVAYCPTAIASVEVD